MKEKVVVIGAGSAMFTRGMVADLIRQKWDAELALVDIDPEALRIAEQLAALMIKAAGAPIRLSASADRRAVLSGASAVICTIGVGGRRAWEQDVFIPRKYGIYQPVGDSVAPGGTSRALRMIPAMVDIARDVLELAPQALFFNYGNPMSAVCRGVRKATGAELVGLCHGVFHGERYLATALGLPAGTLRASYAGMNHLAWITALRHEGVDCMAALKALAQRRAARAPDAAAVGAAFAEAGADAGGADENPVSWELFRRFGAFPAVLDRHTTEFFPAMFCRKNAYCGKTLGVDAYSFEDCIAFGDRIFAEMAEVARSGKLPAGYLGGQEGEHEQVLEIIASLRRDDGRMYAANLPNDGQVPNLPAEAVVECPAVGLNGQLRPIQQSPLPAAVAGTLATRFLWAETVVEAALEGSRDKFIQALILDGACESVATAVALADELLAAQSAYLPQFKAQ